jgi:spore maturation protein CgeB
LPLFYTEEFKPLPSDNESQPRRFSTSFVGTLHTERYAYAKKIFHGRSATFGYFYVQARWYFAVVKYLTAEHKHVPWRDVSFQKLSRQQVSEIFRDSVAVVDIPRRGQSGLTMRTFEVLASGSVLATTNAAVTREPFFDPDRIVLLPNELDDAGLHDALSRLDSMKPPAGPPVGFETYSLESWVRSICGGQSRV